MASVRRVVVAALFFCVLVVSVGAGSKDETPSLLQTTEWLRDFVKAEGTVEAGDWRDHYQVLANSCDVNILHDTDDLSCTRPKNAPFCKGSPPITIHHFKQAFNLKDLDAARISVERELSFHAYAVALPTRNELPRITHSAKIGERFVDGSADSPSRGYVVLPTAEAAQRVASAFRHAVTLCGGTASPF